MISAPLVNVNPAESDEWLLMLAGLSLDAVRPYLNGMGLQLPPNAIQFVTGLRRLFAQFISRRLSETGGDADLPRVVLDWVFTTYGNDFVVHLREWKSNVFKPSDNQAFQAYVWRILVTRGGLSGERDVQPPPPYVTRVRVALSAFPSSPIPASPQSGWDRQLFKRYSYDDGWNPLTYIEAAVRYYRFTTAWDEARRSKAPYDIGEMKVWAKREAEVKRMPIELIQDPVWLPLPKPWR